MSRAEELIRHLRDAQGDSRAQAAIAAEFSILARPEAEQADMRAALDAAAILHWFDLELLAATMERLPETIQSVFHTLIAFPFVERFPREERKLYNVHEVTRLGWRMEIARARADDFRRLSQRAANSFDPEASATQQVEWIYHRLAADPDSAASELMHIEDTWTNVARPEERETLSLVLSELEDTKLVTGRARAWALINIGWTRLGRGNLNGLGPLASTLLELAQGANDARAEAEAHCLRGDILVSQGKLEQAAEAFKAFLDISKRLAEAEPANAIWQWAFAVAHIKSGDVLQQQGRLESAAEAYKEYLDISKRLAESDPANAVWQRELAIAHSRSGDALQQQGRFEQAAEAYKADLEISKRLAESNPTNADWQKDLAVAHSRTGDLLQQQGRLEQAAEAFEAYLDISKRLAESDPTNAAWQRELAVAHSRSGDVLQAQGKLEQAAEAYKKDLEISKRLAESDPANTDRQKGLAVAHSRSGDALQQQGKLEQATEAYRTYLDISRRLAEGDPANAAWQRELAVALLKLARIDFESRQFPSGLERYRESAEIFTRLTESYPGFASWIIEHEQVEQELNACLKQLNTEESAGA